MRKWIITLILRFYPWDFRNGFAKDLEAAINKDNATARVRGGILWRTRFWTSTVWDNLGAARRIRRDDTVESRGSMSRTASLLEDIRQGRRMFFRNLRFQLTAVFVMALGIGATTAAFAVVDGVLLKGLPFPDSERLVQIGLRIRPSPDRLVPVSERAFVALRESLTTVEDIVAVGAPVQVLRGQGDPLEVVVGTVSEGYLETLGASPMLGRLFLPQDHAPGAPRVAALSAAFFETRFGGDPAILGRVVDLHNEPVEIVGVVSPSFFPPPNSMEEEAAIWTPIGLAQRELREGSLYLNVLGRIRPGATPASVTEEGERIIAEAYPPGEGPGFITGTGMEPLKGLILGDSDLPILLAQAGVILLLLLSCVNVASLLLARASDRRREMAVRAAMGARRGQMIRQLLSESLFLAVSAGTVGVGLAVLLSSGFKAYAPEGVPRLPEVGVDGRVIFFALVVSLLVGFLFGLLPALSTSRANLTGNMGDTGRGGTAGQARVGLRQSLVAAQVALAVILALGSGLMANSFFRLTRVDSGFREDGLISALVDLRQGGTDREGWRPFFQQLLDEGRALPGVTAATLTTTVPFTEGGMQGRYTPQQVDGTNEAEGIFVTVHSVWDDYFQTMGIPILEGRPLEPGDGTGGEPVVVVNQAFVREYWPNAASGLNRSVKPGGPEAETQEMRVVGIAGDVRNDPASDPDPAIYVHYDQEPWRALNLILRTESDPALLAPALREAMRRLNPGLPISRVATVSSLGSTTLVKPRFYALLAGCFGLLALTLALVGVYGTTAYATAKRTREIGIRMALGADGGRVVVGVLSGAAFTCLVGISVGMVGGAAGVRFLTAFLFGIDPFDIPTFSVVAILVGATALLAAYLPARRAAEVNPANSLRVEP